MPPLCSVSNFDDLRDMLVSLKPDYLIVEGYNAVGKSILMERILDTLNFTVYRPNYVQWANRVPREYRWSICASFLDVALRTKMKPTVPIILDRGMISGAVYNDDMDIARCYKAITDNDPSILHILVTCHKEDYEKFLDIRNSEKPLSYLDYLKYTKRYKQCFDVLNIPYIEYRNIYDSSKDYRDTCSGCSHYSFHNNMCNNPLAIQDGSINVSPNSQRCKYAGRKEVQDGALLEV